MASQRPGEPPTKTAERNRISWISGSHEDSRSVATLADIRVIISGPSGCAFSRHIFGTPCGEAIHEYQDPVIKAGTIPLPVGHELSISCRQKWRP